MGIVHSSLPELIERKKRIDMHTNVATALLDEIKERKLDTFFEAEEKMITRSTMVRERGREGGWEGERERERVTCLYKSTHNHASIHKTQHPTCTTIECSWPRSRRAHNYFYLRYLTCAPSPDWHTWCNSTNLLYATLSCSSSGETYSAVPTNELARSERTWFTEYIRQHQWQSHGVLHLYYTELLHKRAAWLSLWRGRGTSACGYSHMTIWINKSECNVKKM